MNVERLKMRVQRRCLVLRFWGSEVNVERWKEKSRSEVLKFWGERWKMRGINFAPLCAFAWHTNIISVNFSSGWSESKANRNSVCSVNSVCHLNTRDTRDTWKQIINWLHRFHRYHAAVPLDRYGRTARPQSIKISQLNVREIKDAHAPSGVSSHPGCRSLRSLALGLVLLPRWDVSLRLFAKIYFGNKYSSYLRDHWMPQ